MSLSNSGRFCDTRLVINKACLTKRKFTCRVSIFIYFFVCFVFKSNCIFSRGFRFTKIHSHTLLITYTDIGLIYIYLYTYVVNICCIPAPCALDRTVAECCCLYLPAFNFQCKFKSSASAPSTQ